MQNFDIDALPVGYSNFELLRKENQIYVDKTDLIYSFTKKRGTGFLSRPRRFGKSLLSTTLKSLFEHGLEYFDGLKINDLWHDKTYPVLYLNFAIFDLFNVKLFSERLITELNNFIEKYNINLKPFSSRKDPKISLNLLLDKLDGEMVVIIDEYDAAFSANLDNPKVFEQYRKLLFLFFQVLKNRSDKFRFIFLTGVARFSNTSIFSGFNNFDDLCFMQKYSSLVGFTEEEIDKYFYPFLEKAAKNLDLSVSDLKQNLKNYYDGYSFDEKAQVHVYNPWSILNFLKYSERGLIPYWTGAGFSTLVVNYFKNKFIDANKDHVFNPLLDNYLIDYDELTSSQDLNNLSIILMLYQSGYLTIDSVSGNIYTLRFPNFEIKRYMASFFINNVLCYNKLINKPNFPVGFYKQVIDSLVNQSAEEIKESFGKILNYISYSSNIFNDEISVRDVISMGLSFLGIINEYERQSAKGRCDLVIKFSKVSFAFEFKVARNGDDEEKLVNEAMEQIIDRKYMVDFTTEKLVRVAIVESALKHEFTKCKVCG